MNAQHALLEELIDYAGLFPPAALGMERAVEAYAAHRRSPEAWMLGRFVVPASRLGEFARAAAPHLPEDRGEPAWRIARNGRRLRSARSIATASLRLPSRD